VCRRLGDPAGVAADGPALELEEVPRRALQPSELRIRVAAAGVNFADVLQLQGRYQEKPSLPYVPGSEVRVAPSPAVVRGVPV
jgi:NADPH:quinone reductase-like Zn-dependent oxidoreductase